MIRRWRPSLGLVLGGGLLGTLVISLAGLVIFRYLGPIMGYRQAAVLLGACIALATAFLGWLLWRLLLRPITALRSYAAQVHSAPQSAPDPPRHLGTQELFHTAQSVIEMADTLRDRESAIRSYSDHVTHELKTPIAAIRAATELLEDSAEIPTPDRELIAQIASAGRQIESQLNALRRVARARETRYLGQSRLQGAMALLDPCDITVKIADPQNSQIPLSAEGLSLILGHLRNNALEHGATVLQLELSRRGDQTILTLTDNGTGISPGNQARVFDPFFTTRRDSNGTGMGLAIVRTILEAHRGEIALIPSPNGACFAITFARHETQGPTA